jgi:branched-chain amino acid aminotransferase
MSPTSTTATSTAIERVPHPGPRSDAEREQLMADPGFGRIHTDHMVVVRWTVDEGWHDAKLTAYAPLELDPSAMVLHYGQAIFEGLKAYRQPDGGVAIFRPEENAKRFNRSAARLAMPELPVELFLEAVDLLVDTDRAWVPTPRGRASTCAVHDRDEAQVGMRPAHEYLFLLIAFPVTPFFPGEVKPVTVWLSDEYVRAAVGGTGEAKCAGNYAGSLLAQRQAAEKGCDQVVWLDAVERRWVEEMGGMNLFFVLRRAAPAPDARR